MRPAPDLIRAGLCIDRKRKAGYSREQMNREAPENRRNADMGNQYYQIVEITDLGPFVTRLVLCMPREIMPEEVRPDMFSVHVEIHDKIILSQFSGL